MLIWFARHGGILTGVVTALPLLAAVAWIIQGAWRWSVVAALAAPALGVMMKLLTELIRLLVDTLIPQ